MKRTLLSAILLSALSCGAVAATTHVSSQDKTWLKAAHQVDLEEIQSGTLAQQKTHSDTVRSTAKTLVSDHRRLDSKLVPLARHLDVSLPDSPSAKQQSAIRKLQGKSDTDFDKTFVRDEIKGHKQAISQTNKEIADGSSSQVKDLAQQALPQLKKHLQILRRASHELGNGG